MRFGIMGIQPASLVPADLKPERAQEHIAGFNQAKAVRELASRGFKLIELGGDLPLFFPQAFSPGDVEQLAAAKQELGLTYTVHLPLWSIEPSTLQKDVREGSVRALVENIRATLPLEPEVYAMHSTGALAAEFYRMSLPETARALVLRQFQANAALSLKTILAETGVSSRKLAIETIEFPFDLMLELAEQLDTSITFDTGHILAGFSGPIEFFEALDRALPRLAEIHLHDAPLCSQAAPGYGKDHQRVGAGDLNLARFLDVLAESNFDGPIVLELDVDDALASLETINSIRPQVLHDTKTSPHSPR